MFLKKNNFIIPWLKYIKPIFVLGLCIIIVWYSFGADIISLSFDNIIEVYSVIKTILWKLNIINSEHMVIKTRILAFNIIPFLIILLYLWVICIAFIITNIKFFLYIILVYIFVKCLLINFYLKHFKLFGTSILNINKLFRKKIALIISLLLMIPIRFLIRICIFTLYDFHNDILCIIWLVLLTLPFVYYFKNLISKYIVRGLNLFNFKSVKVNSSGCVNVNSEDYYLFNDYVIKNINLFNLIFVALTVLIIKYYLYLYLTIILLLLILVLLVLWSGSSSSRETLQSTNPPLLTFTMAAFMTDLGTYLTWGGDLGCSESEEWARQKGYNLATETNSYDQFLLKKVSSNHFNSKPLAPVGGVNNNRLVTTYNWLHKDLGPSRDGIWLGEQDVKHGVDIMNSKILRMVYIQRCIVELEDNFRRELGIFKYQPQTIFKNEKYTGSVGRINNTLVVNFLKNDTVRRDLRLFSPTHYVHDEALRQDRLATEPVVQAIRFLEEKYGIYIPNRNSVQNIITLTESEDFIDEDSASFLFKVMRPCPSFTDLNTMYETPEKYFLCKKKQDWGYLAYGTIYNKVLYLQANVGLKDKNIEDSEYTLNELYREYLVTRLSTFGSLVKMESDPNFNLDKIIGKSSYLYNYKSDSDNVKNLWLFKADYSENIFHFKKESLIGLPETRNKLLEMLKSSLHPFPSTDYPNPTSFFVVSANKISMELLYIQKSWDEEWPPMIFSIMDKTNKITTEPKFLIPVKQSYNILDYQDGETLKKLLRYGGGSVGEETGGGSVGEEVVR